MTPEQRKNVSDAMKKKVASGWEPPFMKWRKENNYPGFARTKKTRKKMSEAALKNIENGHDPSKGLMAWRIDNGFPDMRKNKSPDVATRKRISETLKRKYADGEIVNDTLMKWREEHGDPALGTKRSYEFKEACRQRNLGKKMSKSTRLKISKANKGNIMAIEQRIALSKLMSEKVMSGELKPGRGIGGYYKNTGTYMKSSWEIKFAKWLDANNIQWEYESFRFQLPNKRHYVPDFYIPKLHVFVEVKGYMTEYDVYKLNSFTKAGFVIHVIDDVNNLSIGKHNVWKFQTEEKNNE